MPVPARRMVNPRLGAYFAIYASACVALVLLALIGEQLGADTQTTRLMILAGPVFLGLVIALSTRTGHCLEYFAAGRRVPAVYGGLTLAFSAFGGTGLVAVTGAFFLIGFDALCLAIGGLSGFVVMAVLLAPFFRKFGAYTIPSYLGARFESTALRLVAAALLCLPMAMVLMAELKTAAFAAGYLTGAPAAVNASFAAAIVMIVLWSGGTRALTWAGVAQGIATLLALLVPVTIVAIWMTNLPLPHLSQGPMLRSLARLEAVQGVPIVIAPGLAFDMPGSDLIALAKRYSSPFGAIGPHGFVTAMLTIMMGVAAAPWLLPRVACAPGVYQARKSLAWATVIFGLIMLTLAAVAIFARSLLATGVASGSAPDWVRALAELGLAEVETRTAGAEAGRNVLTGVRMSRDAVLMAMPAAAGMTAAFTAVAASGAFAACLLGAAAAASALQATMAEDLWHGARKEPPSDTHRIGAARIGLAIAIPTVCAASLYLPGDPLALLLWALALTGSTLFPVLVLSVWWKRLNTFGAMAGIVTGFSVALLAIVAGAMDIVLIDPALAGMFGIPASLLIGMTTSLMTPPPSRQQLELVRDIRVPGGEILYDREMRLLRLKTRQRSANL